MDSRSKIITAALADLPSLKVCTAVIATFDVLTAERIERLREIAFQSGPLAAVVTEDPDSLLTLQARAELAAALAIIDVVIMADEPLATLLPRLHQNFAVVDQREADALSSRQLMEHIRRKSENPSR